MSKLPTDGDQVRGSQDLTPNDPWTERFEGALAAGNQDIVAQRLSDWVRDDAIQAQTYAKYLERLSADCIARFPHLARRRAMRSLERELAVEALDWLEIAAAGLGPDDVLDAIDIDLDRALVLREDGRWAESSATLHKIASRTDLTERQQLRVLNLQAVAAISSAHDYALAQGLFERIVALAKKQTDKVPLLTALINRALSVHRFGGRFDRMVEDSDEVERVYRGEVPLADRVFLHRIRARAAVESENANAHMAAHQYLSEADWARADALVFSALGAVNRGETEHVGEWLDEVERRSTPHSIDLLLASCVRLRWHTMEQATSWSQVLELIERRMHPEPFWSAWAQIEVSRSLALVGETKRAFDLATAAAALADRHGFRFELFRARLLRAFLGGSPAEARRALDICRIGSYESVLLGSWRVMAGPVLQAALDGAPEPTYPAEQLAKLGTDVIRIRLFGGLSVWVGAQRVDERAWGRPKSRALLAYLALRHGQPTTYDEAAFALWPDLEEKIARQSLHNALSHVRRALGADTLSTGSNLISLRNDVWVDIAAWRQAAKSKDEALMEQLHELASNPLLPEYLYEDWTFEDRMLLEAKALD